MSEFLEVRSVDNVVMEGSRTIGFLQKEDFI